MNYHFQVIGKAKVKVIHNGQAKVMTLLDIETEEAQITDAERSKVLGEAFNFLWHHIYSHRETPRSKFDKLLNGG